MSSQSPRTAAVLLAAGNASRFGAAKQTLLIEGIPMVRRAAMTALDAGLSPVIVVIGAYGDATEHCLAGLPVQLTKNSDWASGMGSSLALGVRTAVATEATLHEVLVMLADQPGISAAELNAMIKAHASAPERIRAARYQGHLGPPSLFPRAYFDELISMHGTSGARRLLERHAGCVDAHDLPSAAFDIDMPTDHAAWLAKQGR
ncbi:MAG: nucleotidyltransferase family protein [Rhodanobacter sp.]